MKNLQDNFSYGQKMHPRQWLRPALRWRSHNLVCRDTGLVIGFTPKAGCSFVAKIFFHNAPGHSKKSYIEWPHRYRIAYQQSVPMMPSDWFESKITRVKFVRNPFARAVSSYFQAMRTKLNSSIALSFGVDLVDFCFEEYLDWLATTHIDLTNPHFCPQKFWLEGKVFRYDMVLRIEDIGERIILHNDASLEVPKELRKSRHHNERQKQEGYKGSTAYSRLQDSFGTFPTWECFYNEKTTEQVAQLYDADFCEYGYEQWITRK